MNDRAGVKVLQTREDLTRPVFENIDVELATRTRQVLLQRAGGHELCDEDVVTRVWRLNTQKK